MTHEHQDWKAAQIEAARKTLKRRNADIAARTPKPVKPLEDFKFLDFRHVIKNTDINTP